MLTREERAKKFQDAIQSHVAMAREKGMKSDIYGVAASAVLGTALADSLTRIERLEGDIKLLTDLLASVENRP